MTIVLWSLADVARHTCRSWSGLKRIRHKMPAPDATTPAGRELWHPSTIEAWIDDPAWQTGNGR